MKLNKFLGGLALTAILGAGFASCSNDVESSLNSRNDMLLKAPMAKAYAGNQKWDPFKLGGTTKGTRADAGVTSQECKTDLIDREHEKEIIEEWLPEKNGNLKDGIDTDFLFYADEDLSLEFYPVFSQTTTPNSLGVFYWDAEGNYHEMIVWDNMDPWSLSYTDWTEPVKDSWVEDPTHYEGGYYAQYGVTYSKGIQINVPEGCTFGFFWNGHNNTGETKYYSSSEKNEEVNCTDGDGNPVGGTSKIHAVTFELEGKTYLGLEDWTDFDFQDWVFTCDQVLTTVDASTFVPGQTPSTDPDPETPENPDPETPENPDPETPDTPDPEIPDIQIPDVVDPGFTVDPEKPAVKGEVEVNLALDEKEDGDIRSSHLSIHIRKATDVEIFIPVPRQYYCEADDMAIVMQHEQNHMAHGGPTQFTWTLKDSDLQVSLFVQYEDDGIRIWTDGVTQEVIDWCYEKCQDGITFEVWNYFNDPEGYPLLSAEELRSYLDQATIKFLDEVPDWYINSFADPNGKYDPANNPEGDDFHVTPEYPNDFDAPFEGEHLNNSDVNDIYKKSDRPTPPPVPVY